MRTRRLRFERPDWVKIAALHSEVITARLNTEAHFIREEMRHQTTEVAQLTAKIINLRASISSDACQLAHQLLEIRIALEDLVQVPWYLRLWYLWQRWKPDRARAEEERSQLEKRTALKAELDRVAGSCDRWGGR